MMYLTLPELGVEDFTGSEYTGLACSSCKTFYSKDSTHTYCQKEGCGKPLLAYYNLPGGFDKNIFISREPNMWRYKEFLPVINSCNIISLGEGFTPVSKLDNLSKNLNTDQVFLKDESFNPTGSFKARGLSMAISKAKELGIEECVIPTAGNAGGAMAAYCAKAGIKATVYMPRNTPEVFKQECELYGATLIQVDGNISDCGKMVSQQNNSWFNVSTLKEPFRIEGKKTLGYEIAEQFGWHLPDVILYPTGGGTGLIGIWKAFNEMEEMGWIGSKRPKMVAVQAKGCTPIVDAYKRQEDTAEFYQNAKTIANGLCVPKPFGDTLILNAIKQSNGCAIAVSDQDIIAGVKEIASKEGKLICPEGAACWAALKKLSAKKWVSENDQVLILNTGSGYKYLENLV